MHSATEREDRAAIAMIDAAVERGPLNSMPTRASIERLEAALVDQPQVPIAVQHQFAEEGRLYVREITIPADTLMTGFVHKREHVSILLSGEMTVMTPDGMQRVCGPKVMIAPAGTKRVGIAHSETRWVTVHLTSGETDIEKLEAELVEQSQLVALPSQRLKAEVLCQS